MDAMDADALRAAYEVHDGERLRCAHRHLMEDDELRTAYEAVDEVGLRCAHSGDAMFGLVEDDLRDVAGQVAGVADAVELALYDLTYMSARYVTLLGSDYEGFAGRLAVYAAGTDADPYSDAGAYADARRIIAGGAEDTAAFIRKRAGAVESAIAALDAAAGALAAARAKLADGCGQLRGQL